MEELDWSLIEEMPLIEDRSGNKYYTDKSFDDLIKLFGFKIKELIILIVKNQNYEDRLVVINPLYITKMILSDIPEQYWLASGSYHFEYEEEIINFIMMLKYIDEFKDDPSKVLLN